MSVVYQDHQQQQAVVAPSQHITAGAGISALALDEGSEGIPVLSHYQHQHHSVDAHVLPRFDDTKLAYPPPPLPVNVNTPAPNVPLVSPLYSSGIHHHHQSHQHQLRAPPKVFHQGLSSSSSNSLQFDDINGGSGSGTSIHPHHHLPPLAATAGTTTTTNTLSPPSRGLSYLLNPTVEEENQDGNPHHPNNVHPNTGTMDQQVGVRPCLISFPPGS